MSGLAKFTIGVPDVSPQDADLLGHKSTEPQTGGLWPSSPVIGHFGGAGEDSDKEALGKYLGVGVELLTGLASPKAVGGGSSGTS